MQGSHIRTFSIAAAFAAPLLGVIPAHATTDAIYPGFTCMEAGSETGAFNRSEYRITRTGAGNGTGQLICPIVRHTCGTGYDSGWLDPVRANGFRTFAHTMRTENSGDLSCRVMSKNKTGSTIYLGALVFASPTDGELELYSQSDCSGHYLMSCSMPQNTPTTFAKIFGYEVKE